MMIPIDIGKDLDRGSRLALSLDIFRRHLQCVGSTGSGKTVALHALLRPIMMEPQKKSAVFVIDPLGGLSRDLLLWIASPKCPKHVRRRLVYYEVANDNFCLPFNPLQMAVGDSRYYHVARTVDLMLRAWTAQDLASQPRLLQWSYASMMAMAALGLPISHCQYLLQPGSEEHKAILHLLPPALQAQWMEILKAKGAEPTRILESTRNRWYPLYTAPQTRRMFGVPHGRLDIERIISEKLNVIINVAGGGAVPKMLGETIGALILNEIFETAFRMTAQRGAGAVDSTVVVLDEFQKFVSPDIEDALPTLRQTGLKLFLAHQSFSQLIKGDMDLRNMIFQAQNRLMFANHSEDADLIANELAVMKFDPMKIKNEVYQRKQLIAGHRREWLRSTGVTQSTGHSFSDMEMVGFGQGLGSAETRNTDGETTGTVRSGLESSSSARTRGRVSAGSESMTSSQSETLVPIHEDLTELSSRQYFSFEEQRLEWMRIVRQLKTGHCFGKFADDPSLYRILVKYDPVAETASTQRRLAELIQQNYEQDFFISSNEADRLAEEARRKLLETPRIVVNTTQDKARSPAVIKTEPVETDTESADQKNQDPFRRARRTR